MTLPVEGFLNLDQQTPPNPSDDPLSVQVETTPGVGSQVPRGKKPVSRVDGGLSRGGLNPQCNVTYKSFKIGNLNSCPPNQGKKQVGRNLAPSTWRGEHAGALPCIRREALGGRRW